MDPEVGVRVTPVTIGAPTARDFLASSSFWTPQSLVASTWHEHAPFAFWLTEFHKPRLLVELGVYKGFSYGCFCQAIEHLGLETRAYAIDTWKGDAHGGVYGEEVFSRIADYQRRYSSFSRLVRSTFDEALPHFLDGSVDLLHIDGRHRYEDVEHDFTSWAPKLSNRSIVVFHDTNVRERGFGVAKFWEEIRGDYPSFEFFHGHGLGVLGFGSQQQPELRAFFEAAADERSSVDIRAAYSRLGALVSLDWQRHHDREEAARLQAERAGHRAQLADAQDRAADLERMVAARDRDIELLQQRLRETDKPPSWPLLSRPLLSRLRAARQSRFGIRLAAILHHPTSSRRRKAYRAKRLPLLDLAEAEPALTDADPTVGQGRPIDEDRSIAVPIPAMSQLSSNLVRPGIILHVSNPDLAWEVRTYLDAMPCPADLYISTSDEAAKATLTRAFASWGCGNTTIRIVPKWGEDIASGLVAFPGVYDAHDIVLQLHLGQYSNDTSAYARGYALETLMGSREIVSSILNVFLKNPTIGMIAPQHFENLRSSIHWGSCFETAAKLAGKMGLDLRPTTVLDFPMGGLFWARSAALRPLLSLDLSSEAAAYDDDTLASAIERLSFFACEIAGFRWIKIARPEICAMRSTICEVQDEDQLGLVLSQQTFRLLPDGYIHSPVAG